MRQASATQTPGDTHTLKTIPSERCCLHTSVNFTLGKPLSLLDHQSDLHIPEETALHSLPSSHDKQPLSEPVPILGLLSLCQNRRMTKTYWLPSLPKSSFLLAAPDPGYPSPSQGGVDRWQWNRVGSGPLLFLCLVSVSCGQDHEP